MVDENADRGQPPGQQPVPERDIEPLWPPDAAPAGTPGPAWVAHPSAAYPSLSAEVGDRLPSAAPGWDAAHPGDHGLPDGNGRSGDPNGGLPAHDLAATPGHPGYYDGSGPATGTPSGGGSGADGGRPGVPGGTIPAPDATARHGAVEHAVPAPRPGQAAPVDLDLPFTLDPAIPQPAPGTPETGGTAGAAPHGPVQGQPPAFPPAPRQPAGPADHERPADHQRPAGTAAGPAWGGPSAEPVGSGAAYGTPVVPVETLAAAGGPGSGESPWAQPPQRTSAGAAEAVGTAAVPGEPDAPAPTPPKLGPFPPSPGTPLAPPAPDPTTGYPPGPTLTVPPPHAGPPNHPHAGPPNHSHAGPPAHAGPTPGAPAPGPGPAQPVAGWYGPSWQHGTPPAGVPRQPQPEQPAPTPGGYPEPAWTPEVGVPPTAEDFARRRQVRPADPVATTGLRAVVNRMGLVKLPPGRHEQELRRDIEMVRRNFGGLRQVTVVNPKGGAGKTVAILLLAMTFGQKRGGYVLAWDNNETQGTLGMRAQQDFHSRTVRDMLRDLGQFQGAHGRVGDLSQYVRSQGEGMFDVLASDESATGGEMLTAAAFAEIREVVSRFYKLIFVDTGNNVRAQNWQAAMDATDQLVVTMSARNDSAETAARMLDHLEQSGRHRLVRQAVTVVSMPPSRKEIDLPAIQEHFAARTRAVLLAPYERLIDTGEPIRYGGLSSATRDAWLKIAAAVAEGL
ncbi:MinD/ParA family ATP-binding protein [Micromonospora sp. CPCC 205556]|uniref:MinD/ParA family ATP-binding protein n=1 Tax=Micromonospora sp. CPCC 205556 TaxID=3122398 RepID=UPI002FF26305